MVSSWNSIAQTNQFTEGEWERASSTWIVRKKGTIQLCVCVCVCVQKETTHDAQSMFLEITFSTALEMLTNLSLFTEATESC